MGPVSEEEEDRAECYEYPTNDTLLHSRPHLVCNDV